MTAGYLVLREQATIYEEQLANMEARHKTVRGREGVRLQCAETWKVYSHENYSKCSRSRSVGEKPRPVVTNTVVMTPVTLLKSQHPSQQKHMERGLKREICNLGNSACQSLDPFLVFAIIFSKKYGYLLSFREFKKRSTSLSCLCEYDPIARTH